MPLPNTSPAVARCLGQPFLFWSLHVPCYVFDSCEKNTFLTSQDTVQKTFQEIWFSPLPSGEGKSEALMRRADLIVKVCYNILGNDFLAAPVPLRNC